MNEYSLEHILSHTGVLANPPEVIGPLPEGIRVNFYSVGGELSEPGLNGQGMYGKLRPVGGDWVTVRNDGVGLLNVRGTIETTDGALILITYEGMVDFGKDGQEKFMRGEFPPTGQAAHGAAVFHQSPGLSLVEPPGCLGIGEYHPAANQARYDVYAIR